MHLYLVLCLMAWLCAGGTPNPKHIEPTTYPLGARLAHLEGTVSAHVEIEKDGAVSRVTAEGRPVFTEAVRASLQNWVFYTDGPAQADIVFEFRLIGKPLEQNAQTLITYDLPSRVTVTTQPPVCDHCPEKSR